MTTTLATATPAMMTEDAPAKLKELVEQLRESMGQGETAYRRSGGVLLRIHGERLYKAAGASTFKAFCKDTLDISDAQAYQTMGAARFAVLVEAEAPELPTPATEYTYRPMGRLETDGERLECWRRTVERVRPAEPTHEDVKATVTALTGGVAAAPTSTSTRKAKTDTSLFAVDLLADGLRGVLAEAGADRLLDRLTAALARVGLKAEQRLEQGQYGGLTLKAVTLSVLQPSDSFVLRFACGDPAILLPKTDRTPKTKPKTSRAKPKTPPAITHDRELSTPATVEAKTKRPGFRIKTGLKTEAAPTSTPDKLTTVSGGKAGRPPGPDALAAREYVRSVALPKAWVPLKTIMSGAADRGLDERKVRDAVRLVCETEVRDGSTFCRLKPKT